MTHARNHGMSSWTARGRQLLGSLATDEPEQVRQELADGLHAQSDRLDSEGRQLLRQVRASLEGD